jgi:hypothetical protein
VGAFIDANTPWYAYCFRDAGGAAGAPQGEQKLVTGYTSATGLFTTEAFSVPIAVGDDMIIMSGRIAAIPDIKAVTDLLPDAGALTTIGTDTARLTAARAAVLTDLIDGGRLDLILDAILATESSSRRHRRPATPSRAGSGTRSLRLSSTSRTGSRRATRYARRFGSSSPPAPGSSPARRRRPTHSGM